MKIIKKALQDLGDDYFVKHLQIVNVFLPKSLTSKEIDVLAAFMSLDGELVKKDRFGTTARKVVMEKYNLSPGGLGNYLKSLKDKGAIFINDYNVLEVKGFLLPDNSEQGYQFKIKR